MSSPTAKELLAQADRLMRQRTPEELPVLTDLVIEEIEIPSLSDRMDEVIPTHSRPVSPTAVLAATSSAAVSRPPLIAPAPAPIAHTPAAPSPLSAQLEQSPPLDALFAGRPRASHETPSAAATFEGPNTQSALASVREKFNEQLLAKMDELQHSVFSQVMQKLEISASGSLKAHLRQTLEPALIGIARELAEQVAEDTATQVRQVVSDAVDAEIARLRAQFAKKRL